MDVADCSDAEGASIFVGSFLGACGDAGDGGLGDLFGSGDALPQFGGNGGVGPVVGSALFDDGVHVRWVAAVLRAGDRLGLVEEFSVELVEVVCGELLEADTADGRQHVDAHVARVRLVRRRLDLEVEGGEPHLFDVVAVVELGRFDPCAGLDLSDRLAQPSLGFGFGGEAA